MLEATALTTRVVRERIDPRLTASLFANYRSAIDALLELVDNAVDSRATERTLRVDLVVRPESNLGSHRARIRAEGQRADACVAVADRSPEAATVGPRCPQVEGCLGGLAARSAGPVLLAKRRLRTGTEEIKPAGRVMAAHPRSACG